MCLGTCQTLTINRSVALLLLVVAGTSCISSGSGDQAVVSPTTTQLETTQSVPASTVLLPTTTTSPTSTLSPTTSNTEVVSTGYGIWIDLPEDFMTSTDWVDTDEDGVDDRWQEGPGEPDSRVRSVKQPTTTEVASTTTGTSPATTVESQPTPIERKADEPLRVVLTGDSIADQWAPYFEWILGSTATIEHRHLWGTALCDWFAESGGDLGLEYLE
ncbi:uncharacterized protein METZ01_LOCUS453941, partial [marine metagenome]